MAAAARWLRRTPSDVIVFRSCQNLMECSRRITYWVVNSIVTLQGCRVCRINEFICGLKRMNVWVDPRQLRVGDLFDDEANKLIAKVLANVYGEILNSRIHLHPLDELWESVSWD
jgi:hypothetical protein